MPPKVPRGEENQRDGYMITKPFSNSFHAAGRLHKSASAHPCSIGDLSLNSSSSAKS